MNSIRNLFFDVGNTLLFPDWERMLAPLLCRGVRPTPEQLANWERRTKAQFDAIEHDGRQDHGFWFMFYRNLLGELGIEDANLQRELVEAIRLSENWRRIRPGTRENLLGLARQYEIAVISNADGKIHEVLGVCGIADCFRTITDSGIVGHEKPHPVVFQEALRSMRAEPEASLYIGDVYSVDYVGATGVGMKAVLFDACGAYRTKGVQRVESLEELREVLPDFS